MAPSIEDRCLHPGEGKMRRIHGQFHSQKQSIGVVPVLKKRKSKTLRFAEHDEVIEIKHFKEMSEDDVGSMWISREDMMKMRSHNQDLVRLIELQDPACMENVCLRGLDQHTLDYTKRRKSIQNLIYWGMGRVQRLQQEGTGADISDSLAEISRKCSSASVEEAIRTAMVDTKDAYR